MEISINEKNLERAINVGLMIVFCNEIKLLQNVMSGNKENIGLAFIGQNVCNKG
ncbi:unnamed protein product [Paramecium sonneborni]|uniref:Uncharacterized protein n=1 Tax=Paramecium sonneborni TaxID=65129 RepID=A0A8S1MKT7_9CILI|nr:unnamed protein product [Paramecium sonneborni]